MASRKNTENVTINSGTPCCRSAFKKEKRTSNCLPNTNHFGNSCVKRLTFIYMTLHSLVPNTKNFYNLKNNLLPMFITWSAKTHNLWAKFNIRTLKKAIQL